MRDPIQAPPGLQDGRDYTPADRAARTRCVGLVFGGRFFLRGFEFSILSTILSLTDGIGKQLTHFGSRVQSVEGCPTVAHLEHVNCPLQAV
ncbi:hypothetical protein TNCV_3116831 [Trichonephila clavipes]|nr:hypothetical protein TNCV_3116831 [Trichonephila clavipes]